METRITFKKRKCRNYEKLYLIEDSNEKFLRGRIGLKLKSVLQMIKNNTDQADFLDNFINRTEKY